MVSEMNNDLIDNGKRGPFEGKDPRTGLREQSSDRIKISAIFKNLW